MIGWTALKTFLHTFIQSKSNDMSTKPGVFIRSERSYDDIISACNALIQNTKSGGNITAVRSDKTYRGVKVYLSGENIVQELLDKKFLYETGDDFSTIHPLTTHLIVRDAILSTTETEKLQKTIEDTLGPVLSISQIPISKKFPNIGSGNWRVRLDIPEIGDLDVYKSNGLPDNFTVNVSGVGERLSVTFYCTRCEKHGHTQWGCSKSIGIEKEGVSRLMKEEESPAIIHKTPTSGFRIRDREEENKEREITSKTNPLLKMKNIREFESKIGKEEVRSYCDSAHGKGSRSIKKEVRGFSSSDSSSGMKRPHLSEGDEKRDSQSKKARTLHINDDDGQTENMPKASSTTHDVDACKFSKINSFLPSSSVGGLFTATRNAADDSVSTSNQPAPTADAIKSDLPSTDDNDSDSNQGLSASVSKPVRQKKKPTQGIPIVIPDRIKTLILNIEGGILNVDQLTAFLNHVKKKSKPCNFAKIYTDDVVGLRKQLEEIKIKYYMIPDRGTNEEIQFMKWFTNTLDRFDGTPSTRTKKST